MADPKNPIERGQYQFLADDGLRLLDLCFGLIQSGAILIYRLPSGKIVPQEYHAPVEISFREQSLSLEIRKIRAFGSVIELNELVALFAAGIRNKCCGSGQRSGVVTLTC